MEFLIGKVWIRINASIVNGTFSLNLIAPMDEDENMISLKIWFDSERDAYPGFSENWYKRGDKDAEESAKRKGT